MVIRRLTINFSEAFLLVLDIQPDTWWFFIHRLKIKKLLSVFMLSYNMIVVINTYVLQYFFRLTVLLHIGKPVHGKDLLFLLSLTQEKTNAPK
jgi:hypothetical protein